MAISGALAPLLAEQAPAQAVAALDHVDRFVQRRIIERDRAPDLAAALDVALCAAVATYLETTPGPAGWRSPRRGR
jgi:hypothetical protein